MLVETHKWLVATASEQQKQEGTRIRSQHPIEINLSGFRTIFCHMLACTGTSVTSTAAGASCLQILALCPYADALHQLHANHQKSKTERPESHNRLKHNNCTNRPNFRTGFQAQKIAPVFGPRVPLPGVRLACVVTAGFGPSPLAVSGTVQGCRMKVASC